MPKKVETPRKILARYQSSVEETRAKKKELQNADRHLRSRMKLRDDTWPKYKQLDADVNEVLGICVKLLGEANKKGAADAKTKGKPWKRLRLPKLCPNKAFFSILERQKKNIERRTELVKELAETVEQERILSIATFIVSSRLKVGQGKEALKLVTQILDECDDVTANQNEDVRLVSETLSRFSSRLGP